jgi:hypothetical protein
MITNFEEYTKELTENERDFILPILVKVIRARTKDNPISNPVIVKNLQDKFNIKTSEPRIRKIIACIRTTGLIVRLVGTSKGYHSTNDRQEILDYIETMEQRKSAISLVIDQMHYHLRMLNNNQQTNEVSSNGFIECP